jgi:hypothetical protein
MNYEMSIVAATLGVCTYVRRAVRQMPVEQADRLALLLLSTVHACVVAGYGVWKWDSSDTEGCSAVLSVSLGYFIHDSCYGTTDLAMGLHHALGMGLLVTALRTPAVHPAIAPLALVEISSIFLNLKYVLRLVRVHPWIYRANLAAFALTFVGTRILWMPYVLVQQHEVLAPLGPARWLLAGLSALNVWWCRAIFHRIRQCTKKSCL